MKKKLLATTNEALSAILPIILIVFFFALFVSPMPVGEFVLFLGGAGLLIFGMGLLTTGMDLVLIPLGNNIGVSMTSTRKIFIIGLVSFVIGVTIAFAGPDLWVLAGLVPGISEWVILITASVGAGFSLLLAVLRIIFGVSLAKILVVCYGLLIFLAIIAPSSFVPVAFDAGGVVTGPISVPFILAMGVGIASVRSDTDSMDDSFGLVALCVVGPVMAMLVIGLLSSPADYVYYPAELPLIETTRDVFHEFSYQLPLQAWGVLQSIWPVFAVFIIYQAITRIYHLNEFLRMLIGFGYTYFGLVLFMMGVEVGFIPIGQFLGSDLANSPMNWLLVPAGALIGYFVVAAEPAIHALRKQIEEVSLGVIPGTAVQRYLAVGVSVALALTMARIILQIPIYWLLFPCYIAAIILTFFVPKIYVGIAFDTAGAVTGPMTSSFILPMAIGATLSPERVMLDAFGTVALIAMTPPVTLQIMGLVYKNKMQAATSADISDIDDEVIIFTSEDEL
ncbi:MAG: DUF1538 domain-containing protein [Defluviitaleaceae bacterium]|nr:DUF1538 domain-containing protein [Defluviitaleaceae bacterium]